MSDWLLSDEEMAKTTGHTIGYLHFDRVLIGKFRIIAKAQAKKLVEWLEAEMENAPLGLRLARFEKCLEDLKKEVLKEKPPFSMGCGGDS